MMLFHLALISDWHAAQAAGEYRVSTIGRTLDDEGFIHCSYEHQVEQTRAAFYNDRDDVVLLTIDPALIASEIKVEGGFPHIYGPVPVDAVTDVRPVSSPA